MQDTLDTTQSVQPENTDAVQLASVWYPILLSQCSVRANNVLQVYCETFSDKSTFFQSLMNLTWRDVMNFRNCGRLTAKEILNLAEQLRINSGYTDAPADDSPIVSLPSNIDSLLPLLKIRIEGLSIRAKNAISLFLQDKGNSVTNFYMSVTAPSFRAKDIKNVGRNTVPEVQDFIESAILFIDGFADDISVDTAVQAFTAPKLSSIFIPEKHHDHIKELQEELGHFPLFATISAYLDSLNDETKIIIDGCIRVHIGQSIIDRKEVADKLGLTAERVRQKRKSIIEELTTYFSNIRKSGFVSDNPYTYIMTHTEDYVNSTEGTDFTPNFVRWVLGSAFDGVTIVGDIFKPLTSFYNDDLFINIVPTELCQYFDFNAYVAALDEKLAEKRTDEERVNLKSFMLPFFKVKYFEDQEKDIETACRSILYLTYELEVDMGQIIFKPNKRKNNPDIIEDILRAAGHSMTLDELYDEFTFQYPERSVAYESFRGNIANNPNIIPVSKTSTYALAEWQSGDYRGGTIREFVREYLDSLPSHIATVEATGDYVRQFRPTSSNESIVSNLSQDKTQKYAFYTRDDQRYIGYRDCSYDVSFVLFDPERVAKRPTEESMRLLLSFINEHKHFPLSQPNGPEETRLYRFVDNMRSLYNRDKMDAETAAMWNKFYDEYGVYRLPRKDAEEVDFISLKIREYLNTIDWTFDFISINEMISQVLDYFIFAINEFDKDLAFRTFIQKEGLSKGPLGLYFLETIFDRYVFNTKRSSNWDGKEWIAEDILKFFEYDDESINRLGEDIDETRKLIAKLRDVQNNLG